MKTYQDIDGWFDFDDIYLQMINLVSGKAHFVEVGSWLGKSASFMADSIKKTNKNIKFDCVDIWAYSVDAPFYSQFVEKIEDTYLQFLKNMKECDVLNIITPIKLDSATASLLYDDNSLDFVFIDANHEYEFVKKDIELWYPKVKIGGYIGGHDYLDYATKTHIGVCKAVDERFKKEEIIISRSSWLHQKK